MGSDGREIGFGRHMMFMAIEGILVIRIGIVVRLTRTKRAMRANRSRTTTMSRNLLDRIIVLILGSPVDCAVLERAGCLEFPLADTGPDHERDANRPGNRDQDNNGVFSDRGGVGRGCTEGGGNASVCRGRGALGTRDKDGINAWALSGRLCDGRYGRRCRAAGSRWR